MSYVLPESGSIVYALFLRSTCHLYNYNLISAPISCCTLWFTLNFIKTKYKAEKLKKSELQKSMQRTTSCIHNSSHTSRNSPYFVLVWIIINKGAWSQTHTPIKWPMIYFYHYVLTLSNAIKWTWNMHTMWNDKWQALKINDIYCCPLLPFLGPVVVVVIADFGRCVTLPLHDVISFKLKFECRTNYYWTRWQLFLLCSVHMVRIAPWELARRRKNTIQRFSQRNDNRNMLTKSSVDNNYVRAISLISCAHITSIHYW